MYHLLYDIRSSKITVIIMESGIITVELLYMYDPV